MQPIEPAELSAYLDGELDSNRARDVAIALATDPALRARYDALANVDAAWRTAVLAAQFTPAVQFEKRKALDISVPILAIVLICLVALLLLSKIDDVMEWSLVLHSIVLTIALPWIVRMAQEEQNQS